MVCLACSWRNLYRAGYTAYRYACRCYKNYRVKGETRRLIQNGGIQINKIKATDVNQMITTADLLNNRYILVQKGKKNYYLISVE